MRFPGREKGTFRWLVQRSEMREKVQVMREESGKRWWWWWWGELHEGNSHKIVGIGVELSLPFSRFSLLS